jgi:hypothetical protein
MLAVLGEAGIDAARLACSSGVAWDPSLNRYAGEIVAGIQKRWGVSPDPEAIREARHHALGYLVRTFFNLTQPHNLGVMRLKGLSYRDGQGIARPLLIYRSGLTIGSREPRACFKSLLQYGGVRHVVNLYGGTFPFADVVAHEKRLARQLGVSYLDAAQDEQHRWRKLVEREQDYEGGRAEAQRRLAGLIREHLLRPGGKAPRGNIYIHCCGGMHRSGMLFGVLRRCINGDSMELIEREYRRHVAFTSEQRPGGFEPLNLRFIREFDCQLLKLKTK